MDFNERTTRKRKKRKSAVFYPLFITAMIAITLCVLFFLYGLSQKNKVQEAMAEVATLEEENSKLFSQTQVDGFVEKAKKEFLDKLKSMVENGDGMLTVLQYFYPDYVIASSDGNYHFFPISETLQKNNFDLDKFTYPVYNEETSEWDGTATYMAGEAKEAKKGIDVSTYQGEINWKKVKNSGIEYAIIRLGFRGYESGKIVLDSRFEDNIKGSLAAGLDTGVYFFTESINEKEAIEEAEFVIENLKDYEINMPVVIDVEESANTQKTRTKDVTAEQRTKNVIAFCETIKKAGYDVMIYGN